MSVSVSVVIPFYQSQTVLHFAINGLLRLSVVNELSIEIVFVDDGSTDASYSIIRKKVADLEEKGFSVVVVRQENKGPAAARNYGIQNSTGNWVSFLDVDDVWYENRFEVLSSFFFDPECDLFCHAEKVRDLKSGLVLGTNYYGANFSVRGLMIRGNTLSPSSTIVRRSIIDDVGGFSERVDFIGVEDYDLWIKLASNNARLKICREVLGEYIRHQTSLSFSYKFYERVNNLLRQQMMIHEFTQWERILIHSQIGLNLIKKMVKQIREVLL
jgi:glycosyltransferase involved in cell wall biosynthesis